MEIGLRKETDFKNPYYLDLPYQEKRRLTRIPRPEYQYLRVWREYFFRFSDQLGETPGYKMDATEILYEEAITA